MGWWQGLALFVGAGFGGLFAWDKAHAIFGTIAAILSIAFAVWQRVKRRGAQHELEEKKAHLSLIQAQLEEKCKKLDEAEEDVRAKQAKLDKIAKAANSLKEHLWELGPRDKPAWFNEKWPIFSRRIITLANFKGGVGKTTISANLAIALSRRGYRVLIIDLDYQGSLDGRFEIGRVDYSERSGTNALLLQDGRLFDTNTLHKLSGQFSGIWVVPAFFGLATLENRLMLQWLLQTCDDDVRFRIARKLLTPEVESQFDVIVMDTPPRLSAASVNALCISTDVLIPTVVDPTSIETVVGFAHTVKNFKKRYNFRLKIHGVIPSLTTKALLSEGEEGLLRDLDNRLSNEGFSARVLPFNVPRKTLRAVVEGEKQLYFADENCTNVFNGLVDSLQLDPPARPITGGKYENSGYSVSA